MRGMFIMRVIVTEELMVIKVIFIVVSGTPTIIRLVIMVVIEKLIIMNRLVNKET